MPISNLSNGLRTGVCTSTNRPTTPYEGQVIYETDTDLTYIYNGTAWQQVSGGTAVGNSGLVYVTSATIGSGVSSVTVSSCFSATYDNYLIMTTGGVTSAEVNMRVTLGSTATGYYFSGLYVQYTSTTVTGRASANDTSWDAGYGNTNSCSSRIELENPFNAKRTIIRSAATNPGTTSYMNSYAGFLDNATSYTAFTITPAGGTMTGGTIRVYGYRQA
jgi:hypothetical protein